MQLIVHRGTDQIGGSCLEVRSSDGSRLLLDLGLPLAAPDGGDWPWGTTRRECSELRNEGILPDIDGLYDDGSPQFSGVVLSHAHLDHHGLAHFVHPEVPVYGSPGTIEMLAVSSIFVPESPPPRAIRTLPRPPESVALGPFRIVAIPVDHAAPDSRAILVEADGRRMLYSGDLRAHGRASQTFADLPGAVGQVDVLVLEGTTIGQSSGEHGFDDELKVEARLAEILRDDRRFMLVVASGQNVDRAVSVYRAAQAADRTFVMDLYQSWAMHRLRGLCPDAPQYDGPGVRVKFLSSHVERMKTAGLWGDVCKIARWSRLPTDELLARPQNFVYLARANSHTLKLLDRIAVSHEPTVVWSLWAGYLEKANALAAWCSDRGIAPLRIHAGGHATPAALIDLAGRIGARVVVPVHTLAAHEFPRSIPGSIAIMDGEVLDV